MEFTGYSDFYPLPEKLQKYALFGKLKYFLDPPPPSTSNEKLSGSAHGEDLPDAVAVIGGNSYHIYGPQNEP